jgi:hypothetical protein
MSLFLLSPSLGRLLGEIILIIAVFYYLFSPVFTWS